MNKKELFELIQKFDASTIAELRYSNDEDTIVLKKYAGKQAAPPSHAVQEAVPKEAPPRIDSGQLAPNVPAEMSAASNVEVITAPVVGTFYRSPSPDSPPFVEEGTSVKAGDTICIVEAMKMMNELEADFDMRIEKILVESGTMLEFGTPLFEVTRL